MKRISSPLTRLAPAVVAREQAPVQRRRVFQWGAAAALGAWLPGCGGGAEEEEAWQQALRCLTLQRKPEPSAQPALAATLRGLAQETLDQHFVRGLLLRVTVDGQEVLTEAFGESGDGEPATTDMYFRNGSVAIALVGMLVLILADEEQLKLDDKVGRWLPDLPHGDRISFRHLAQMTSGFADYVQDEDFVKAFELNPYRRWTPQELLSHAIHKPLFFEPGTNWAYAHTNYVILGLALESLTGRSVRALMQEKVLNPLCLTHTHDPGNASMPEPVLRAYSSERRLRMGAAPGTRFYEESTFWDPSWTITQGAVQVMNIDDMHNAAVAFGRGDLLSPAAYAAFTSTALRGKTSAVPGCPTCFEHTQDYTFGLGVVIMGNWLVQPPSLAGYAAVAAYHPGRRVALAGVLTFRPEAFDDKGNYVHNNEALAMFTRMANVLVPGDAPAARV